MDLNPKTTIKNRLKSNNFIYTSTTKYWGIKIRSVKNLVIKNRKTIVLTIILTLFLSFTTLSLAEPLVAVENQNVSAQVWTQDGHLWINIQLPNNKTILIDPTIGDEPGIPYNDPGGG